MTTDSSTPPPTPRPREALGAAFRTTRWTQVGRAKADSEEGLPKALKQKIDKERLDMHYNLAVVYDSNGMYKDAEREYLKCLKIDPNDAGVHYNLGILYDDKLNQNNRAKNQYMKYLALRPMGENVTQVRQWITDIELSERLGNDVR